MVANEKEKIQTFEDGNEGWHFHLLVVIDVVAVVAKKASTESF